MEPDLANDRTPSAAPDQQEIAAAGGAVLTVASGDGLLDHGTGRDEEFLAAVGSDQLEARGE
jgi:hypothetical protein